MIVLQYVIPNILWGRQINRWPNDGVSQKVYRLDTNLADAWLKKAV